VTDRTGQMWMFGFQPYEYLIVVVTTQEISPALSNHLVVRLDSADRSFEMLESIYRPMEERSDMRRVA
jgi:hypothetical protein